MCVNRPSRCPSGDKARLPLPLLPDRNDIISGYLTNVHMNLNPKQIFLHACFFPPQFHRSGGALINVPLRGFSYPRSHKQITGSDSMKLFHFYSNVLGNFSAEMRFLGDPDRNMGSGQRIKVASFDSCQNYSSALCAFYQGLMIMYEKQTQNGVEWKPCCYH